MGEPTYGDLPEDVTYGDMMKPPPIIARATGIAAPGEPQPEEPEEDG